MVCGVKDGSVLVNRALSDLILQLHISERTGRGVPRIVEAYGRECFEFRENSIVVTISFRCCVVRLQTEGEE